MSQLLSHSLLSIGRVRYGLSARALPGLLERYNSSSQPAAPEPSSTPRSWINRFPVKAQPYLRLARMDKPIGTWLLFLPCAWSTALAAVPIAGYAVPDPMLLTKFAVGAFIMRGAGCTINDLWDKELDTKVARTAGRPLASGQLTPTQAMVFLGAQLTAGLGLLLTFNTTSILTGLAAMPLVVAYPLMKRITYWPQAVLGLTFNWGVFVGWAAVHDALSLPQLLPLYAAGFFWTLVYDSLYAYQDRKDDMLTGIKSVPVLLGDRPQWPLTGFAAAFAASLAAAGCANDLCSLPYYLGCTAASSHLLWQIWTADLGSGTSLDARFRSNVHTGGMVLAAITAGKLMSG